MSETLTAPVTPTARAAAWLARLEAALAARDSAAAVQRMHEHFRNGLEAAA